MRGATTARHAWRGRGVARTGVAAFPSLANTAKLFADNTALMELRTLQAATEGAIVVIHRDGVVRTD